MHCPEEYERIVTYQTLRDAKNVLESVKHQLPCSETEKILDVGCGPGDLTATLLPLYFPKAFTILSTREPYHHQGTMEYMTEVEVGCDISETMIQYAQKKYGCERIQFVVLDIECPSLWINSNKGTFDKIFSSFAIHWMKNLNQLAKNMDDLLKENGHVVSLSLLTHPFVMLFGMISNVTKWKKFTKPWQGWDFQSTDNERRNDYIKILENNNFEIIKCEVQPEVFVVESLDRAIAIFDAVNPFKQDIPGNKYQMFLEDCKDYIELCGLIKQNKEVKNHLQIIKTKDARSRGIRKNSNLSNFKNAKNVLESVKQQLPCSEKEKILDIGCGPGDLTATLLPLYFPKAFIR